MHKIPTLFERDWDGDRSRVIDQVNPAAQWVADGEGVATRKYDGTAVAIIDGELYKRYALTVPDGTTAFTTTHDDVGLKFPDGSTPPAVPAGFQPLQVETSPGRKGPVTKAIGWVPVGDGPDDQWHRDAFDLICRPHAEAESVPHDGVYELIGPKVQANPEHADEHMLVELDTVYGPDETWAPPEDDPDAERPTIQLRGPKQFLDAPRDFDGLRDWLAGRDIEGLVWHHPDGRMAKIKLRDFGLTRSAT